MKRKIEWATVLMVSMFGLIAVISALIVNPWISYRAVFIAILISLIAVGMWERKKKIRIKYFVDDLEQIRKIAVGDWVDLRAAERVELKKGDYYLIRLGVGMILPYGYEAHVLPRSSTPNKFGIMLANSMGVIDNSYSGDADEWKFPAIAIRDTVIEKGDRIAQFRIMENQPRIKFETVEHLRGKSRGGIGSTGKR